MVIHGQTYFYRMYSLEKQISVFCIPDPEIYACMRPSSISHIGISGHADPLHDGSKDQRNFRSVECVTPEVNLLYTNEAAAFA